MANQDKGRIFHYQMSKTWSILIRVIFLRTLYYLNDHGLIKILNEDYFDQQQVRQLCFPDHGHWAAATES